jgi:tetratricopeptide (TPR) repeat protein
LEYLFMDNLEMAKQSFIKCLEEDLDDLLYNVVYCLNFRSKFRSYIIWTNIDTHPYSEIAWHQVGRLHYALKDYENAIRAFDYATW